MLATFALSVINGVGEGEGEGGRRICVLGRNDGK